jgi:serine/threonine-protein kinase RsbW
MNVTTEGPAFPEVRRQLVTLRIPATQTAVRDTLLSVETTLAAAGAAADLRTRTQIALAEACNNIVEHAYKPPCAVAEPIIFLDIAGDQGGVQVTLRDKGRAMPDGPLPGRELPPVDPADVQTLPEGGFGWALLRDVTRALSLSRSNGYNILRFRLLHVETPGSTSRNVM